MLQKTQYINHYRTRAPVLLSRFVLIFLLGSITILTACGGGSNDEGSVTSVPEEKLSCDAIQLNKDRAKPLEKVMISGISGADEENLYIRVLDAAGNEVPNIIFNAAGGDFEMFTTIHPSGSPDGGMTTLLVTNGDVTCPALSLEVLPLALPAKDPFVGFDTAMSEFMAAYQRLAGLEEGIDLSVSLEQLPPAAIPLALIQTAMNSSAYRESLEAMTGDEKRLIYGLLDELDLPALLDGVTDSLSKMPVLLPTVSVISANESSKASRLSHRPVATNIAIKQAFKQGLRTDASCEILTGNFSFDIQTPQDLISYMKEARNTDEAHKDLGRAAQLLNVLFTAVGTLHPVGGFAVGLGTFGVSTVYAMVSNLLPYELDQLSYEVTRTKIEEDWETSQDGKTTWFAARVSARSRGMNFYRTGIDAASTGIDAAATVAALPGGFSDAMNEAITVTNFAGKVGLISKLDALPKSDPNTSCFSIRPTGFGPVNIPNAQLSDFLAAEVQGDAISLSGGQLEELIPVQVGNATLSVSTREDVFPSKAVSLDKVIQVVQKSLKWLPASIQIDEPEKQQIQTVKFRIDNAKHGELSDLDVTPDPGVTLIGSPTGGSNGLFTVQFKPPADRKAYPTGITVTSTSKNLPPNTSPRTARLLILSENKLEITPPDVCISANTSQLFTATLSNPLPAATVIWELDGPGSITDSSGLTETYTAPSAVNYETITLRARLADDDSVNDEITFRLGPCVGPAAFYNVVNSIGFSCTGADEDYEDITIDEFNSNILIPLSSTSIWRPGQRESIDKQFSNSLTCNNITTSAASTNTSSVELLADGESFDIDINLESQSECITDGNNEECSDATAGTNYHLRFETEIGRAENFLMDVSLACQVSNNFLGSFGQPQVSIFVWRVDSQNNPVATNLTDPLKAVNGKVDLQCDQNGTQLSYSKVIEFDAPTTPGSQDRVGASVTIVMLESGRQEGKSNISSMKGKAVFRQLVK